MRGAAHVEDDRVENFLLDDVVGAEIVSLPHSEDFGRVIFERTEMPYQPVVSD